MGQIFKITWKIFCAAIKKMPVIQFKSFKKRKSQFFITRLFYENQTATEMSLYQFSTIFRNCMKIVWQAFSHSLDVWNCMISIFGVWRSTRVIWAWDQLLASYNRNNVQKRLVKKLCLKKTTTSTNIISRFQKCEKQTVVALHYSFTKEGRYVFQFNFFPRKTTLLVHFEPCQSQLNLMQNMNLKLIFM